MKRFLYVKTEDVPGGKNISCEYAGDKGDLAIMLTYAVRQIVEDTNVSVVQLLRTINLVYNELLETEESEDQQNDTFRKG